MKLDNRLRAIVSEIEGDSLLDIGCDHGKVLVSALTEGRVRRATGVDISSNSLKKAELLADSKKVNADFIRADGRDVLFNGYDVCVIAGMGGSEIAEILDSRVSYPETLVLVPHQDKNVLRAFLNERNLFAEKDYTTESGKHYYDIIVVKTSRCGAPYDSKELYTGKNVPATSAFFKKVREREKTLRERIEENPTVSASLKEEWEAYKKWLR